MSRIIKSRYWHEHFLDAVSKHTESPDRFMQWAAFSVLGGVMKRRFFIRDGLFTIYPNQYIVLISPPGIGKGTAIQYTWGLVKQGTGQIANMISDRVTAPKIIQRIADGWSAPQVVAGQQLVLGAKDHSCTIYSTELSVLVGASDQMLDFLCEGWDKAEFEYDTKNSGSAFIKNMCLSLIAATVPDFIKNIDKNKNMPIKGGFTSRCLFIYEDRPARWLKRPQPIENNSLSIKMLHDLRNDLAHIATLPGGEYTRTTGADAIFDKFCTDIKMDPGSGSEASQHFKARIRAHILKLCMILAASRHDPLIIDDMDMMTAIFFVKKVLETLDRVFRGCGDSNLALATGHVQTYIEKNGVASRRELLRNLYRHMDADTLDKVLYVLMEIGFLYTSTSGGTQMFAISPNGSYGSPNGMKKGNP